MPDHAGHPAPYPARADTATPACDPAQPAPAAGPATPAVLAAIEHHGPLRFDRFLGIALYHPDLGYYARPPRPIGRKGDFFTSVSVGPVFAQLLARRILAWWNDAGSPTRWRLVETGAHDATLALDLHAALAELPSLPPPDHVVLEPLPSLRHLQQSRLADTGVRVLEHHAPLAADPLPGFVLANEVLDALPFRLAVRRQNRWQERFVDLHPHTGTLTFVEQPLADGLLPDGPFPDGYATEFRDCFETFLQPLDDSISHGLLLFLDYGFERADLLDPARVAGTLRTYHHHQAGENPLDRPGDLDITAHVDFTSFAEAALRRGLLPARPESQASCLIRHSRDWLDSLASLAEPARQSAIRQFHTLTHPAHLGLRFQAIECRKALP